MKKYGTAELLKLIPEIDHPAFNAMRNAIPGKVSIPVTLYQDEVRTFHAEVVMFGHTWSLFAPALMLVLEELKDRKMEVAWNAVAFTSPAKKFSRSEMEISEGELAGYMKQYRKMDFAAAMADAQGYLQVNETLSAAEIRKVMDAAALKICAVILVSSVEIKSEELKNPPRENAFLKALRRFKP